MSVRSLANEVLIPATDDWVQAYEVAAIAKFSGGAKSINQIRELSLSIIEDLLQSDSMICGDVTEDGFRAWDVDISNVLRRIEQSWKEIGNPDLGDVCWLSITDKGIEAARKLACQDRC